VLWLSLLWMFLQVPSRATPATFMNGLSCFLGGSAGNTLDRLRLGHVTDFLCLPNGLVINLADLGIALGAVLICRALWTTAELRPGETSLVSESSALSSYALGHSSAP
jgi:lipoprotein signal peptidase